MEDSKKLLGSVQIPKEIIDDLKTSAKDIAVFGKKIEEHISQNTTNLLDVILFGAVQLGASDIHLEPQENDVKLRLRLDGLLHDISLFHKDIYHHLLLRIKLLSKIKINITDTPQDGRFTILIEDLQVEIRTSSLPAEYGEAVVMRVLNPNNLMTLETLGLRKDIYRVFEQEIKRPNGMIMVTGPTGSGKTTTLYAFLMKVQNPEIKIITIEDPIEYHIKDVSQTQVATEKGYDFSDGLKSIVRQDPDIILVGEIRDVETAKISLQASLTGHLVFSTLHTNDAAGTIPRLIDLGVNPTSIAPAIKMVISQRLVRKVCQECAVKTKPSKEDLAEIKETLAGISKELAKEIGLPEDLDDIKIAKVTEKSLPAGRQGCESCNFTGYKGRKGIMEVFLMDDEMEKFILTNPPVSAINDLLVKKGMITIYQSGIIEVVFGQTSLEEVKKVVGEEE